MTDFDEFYLGCRDRVVLHVAALTGDPAEALDRVQEAFVKGWTRWDRISGYDDPEAWVRRVAYNHAVSGWRRSATASTRLAETAFELRPGRRSRGSLVARIADSSPSGNWPPTRGGRRTPEAVDEHG